MFSKKMQIVVLVAGMGLPLMMGQGCPGDPSTPPVQPPVQPPGGVQGAQPVTLLSTTRATIPAALTFVGSFNPNATGKVISISVAGNTTGSRPAVRVYDSAFNIVAEENLPVTNTTNLTFVSSSTGDHYIYAREAGTPSSLYTIGATQQP